MTDNGKLQLWQTGNTYKIGAGAPDYLNDDAAAMSLLDTLVEKGFIWSLYGKQAGCLCKVYKMPDVEAVAIQEGDTRRAAVVAAVLLLLESNQ